MNSWITKEMLMEKYEIQDGAAVQFTHKYKNTDYIEDFNNVKYYNETLLLGKRDNKLKMWNENHVNYYEIQINHNMSDSEQARLIIEHTGVGSTASLATYMAYGMWYPVMEHGILLITESSYMKAYNEWSNVYLGKSTSSVFLPRYSFDHSLYAIMYVDSLKNKIPCSITGYHLP